MLRLFAFFIRGLLGLLEGHILLELVQEGRELALEVIVDDTELSDSLTQIFLLFHHGLGMYLERVASHLEIANFVILRHLLRFNLIDDCLGEKGSLDLVSEHRILRQNSRRQAISLDTTSVATYG